MKLKFEVEILEMDDELVAVPVGDGAEEFHGVLRLNDSARFILEQLREDVTEAELVDSILRQYDNDREEVLSFVRDYLSQLQANDLLV